MVTGDIIFMRAVSLQASHGITESHLKSQGDDRINPRVEFRYLIQSLPCAYTDSVIFLAFIWNICELSMLLLLPWIVAPSCLRRKLPHKLFNRPAGIYRNNKSSFSNNWKFAGKRCCCHRLHFTTWLLRASRFTTLWRISTPRFFACLLPFFQLSTTDRRTQGYECSAARYPFMNWNGNKNPGYQTSPSLEKDCGES